MRLVCISDTHMSEIPLPAGDILLHAGDLTYRGTASELGKQRRWLSSYCNDFKKVIVIPGNHDWGFETQFSRFQEEFEASGIHVLKDFSLAVDGLKIWGSPRTPYFMGWAFNEQRGEDIARYWEMIPDDIDILVTHGPPFGILDKVKNAHQGCVDLMTNVKRIRPKLHIFGHIHEAFGSVAENGVLFVNASIMDGRYRPVNAPTVLEI